MITIDLKKIRNLLKTSTNAADYCRDERLLQIFCYLRTMSGTREHCAPILRAVRLVRKGNDKTNG